MMQERVVSRRTQGKLLADHQFVQGMIDMVQTLIDRGHAYVADDGVAYFDVQSFPDYGSLSGNKLDALRSGEGGRVDMATQAIKRHPADFMLWKPDASHLMRWASPWGEGYPGWHLECSVMARALLGDEIDLHSGGEDNIFPHHECEIAQSRGATGADSFARFWMHARFLMVEGEKMSKSKGNFWTVRDVLEGSATGNEVHPAVLRLELIKSHYRSNMNFTKKGLQDSAGVVKRLTDLRSRLEAEVSAPADVDLSHPVLDAFGSALADDLNVAGALGAVLPWASGEHTDPAESLAVLDRINTVLAVAPLGDAEASAESGDGPDIISLCAAIDEARAGKDWPTSDAIRAELEAAGYDVKTTPEGTVAEKKLA